MIKENSSLFRIMSPYEESNINPDDKPSSVTNNISMCSICLDNKSVN